MKNSIIEYTLVFAGLLLLQVLVLDNVHIAGAVNPFIYIYPIIILPVKINRINLTLIGFFTGLAMDALTNSWGVHMAATTFAAYIRPWIFSLTVAHENLEKTTPSYASMKISFMKYAATLVLIHHLTLFSLEAFAIEYIWIVLLKTIVSSIVTMVLIYAIERLKKKNV